MLILQVLIQYKSNTLDRPFSYLYYGNKKVDEGYRVLVHFHDERLIVGYVLGVEETNKSLKELEEEMGFELDTIVDVLDEAPLLNKELLHLVDDISSYYLAPKILVLQKMLPESLSPRKSSLKGPKIVYEEIVTCIDFDEEGLKNKEIELLRLVKRERGVRKLDIGAKKTLESLVNSKHLVITKREKRRLAIPDFEYQEPPVLIKDQQNVVNEFLTSRDQFYLLKGVTGSGKTEVYLRLIEDCVSKGKGAIFLVPEISLTPMMMEYLLKRFKGNVAILHGELSPSERYDEYRKIAYGECNIVIGTRSAIFAPVKDLGLIIIDEEHVESYKQDTEPYYHAREVAFMRAKITKSKVLMGSATPSLETEARSQQGVYHLLKLTKRINNRALPSTEIIDLTDRKNIDRESVIFSLPLRKAIRETLIKGEQVILLLNRRGFSTSIACRNCGHIFRCENCGIALTYHKVDNMMKCHHCDHVEPFPEICPECGGHYFMKTGFGCEKVEEEVLRLFPEAKTVRIDADTTKSRNKIPTLIETFRKHEANVLIGTQMIAKGHDFPGVSLVGIVNADIGLTMPSYRSAERVFQLITQAIGRCGRANIPGRAIIQTYSKDNYAILLAAKQNYAQFFLQEIGNRRLQNYPPFCHLCCINFRGKSENNVTVNLEYAMGLLKEKFVSKSQVLGPITPFYSFREDKIERQILVKYKDPNEGRRIFREILDIFKNKSSIDVTINIDPYNF